MAVRRKFKAKAATPANTGATAAAELGRRGGLRGGKARAAALTTEQKHDGARLAAIARWDGEKGVQHATHEGDLLLGEFPLSCAVLPGGVRVLSQRSVAGALQRFRPGGRGKDEGALPVFMAAANLQPFISEHLRQALANPIRYRHVGYHGFGEPAQGIPAELLVDICDVWIEAKKDGVLNHSS